MLRISCGCGYLLEVAEEQMGQPARCPACAAAVIVPTLGILVSPHFVDEEADFSSAQLLNAKSRRRELTVMALAGLAVAVIVAYAIIRPESEDAAEDQPRPTALTSANMEQVSSSPKQLVILGDRRPS